MIAKRKCDGCGAEIPANAPLGHCPQCLLDLGLGSGEKEREHTPAPPSSGGGTIADYELLEEIGRGGMGIIYKARQITLNRLVALKMVRPGEFATPTMVQRLHLEAEAAANLHHPNIVPIYETGEHHGDHFFSMELIDGVGLDRYIGANGFGFDRNSPELRATARGRQEQIARTVAKVARAVDCAHQHGVLHRDLKPSNILLDRQGEPRLTDFGVAKVIGYAGNCLTASGAIMGTPCYMAPEQAAGQSKRVTTAADIYSLGAILYQMLTGQPPFQAETPLQTLKQVVEQDPRHPTTFRDGVDHDLATICMKCLEKEPQRRYSSARALAEDLERWERREPIQARPVKNFERFWRWCRRNPKVAGLGGAVALLLVALSIGSTLVAFRFNALIDEKDGINRELRKDLVLNLVELYEKQNNEPVVIKSARRRALSGKRPVQGSPLVLTFVEHIYQHPTNMFMTLSPILDALEDELPRRFGGPVAIDMCLVRTLDETYQYVGFTNAVFGRMGPASYVTATDRTLGLRMLAVQNHENPLALALFVRANSDIAQLYRAQTNTPLSQLLSHRCLALTHGESTTGNYLPKQFLATHGVHATNLSRYIYAGSQERARDVVLTNICDVGAGNLELVAKDSELLVIAKFEVPNLGRCWVAGKELDPGLEGPLRQCLLELTDPVILRGLESEVSGFKKLNPQGFERLRNIMREAAAFDQGMP